LFAHKLYAYLQTPLEVLGVDNAKLDLFVKDVPFNFRLEQALESLGDLGMLAEVVWL